MINRKKNWLTLGLCGAALLSIGFVSSGCSDDADQQVQAPPPAPPALPPPPEAPSVTPIEQLMAELNIDPRVSLPEEVAPDNDVDRKAVLVFFDAIARGNNQALKGMLPLTDQIELEALVESGAWKQTVAQIKLLQLQTGAHELNKCALAVIEVGSGASTTFQPQLWYYTTEEDTPTFEAAPTPPGVIDRLSGDDWILAWHQLLAEELLIAERDDEVEQIVQKDIQPEAQASTSTNGGMSGGGGGRGGIREIPDAPPPPPGEGIGGPGGR
jgi:hypothetical protein